MDSTPRQTRGTKRLASVALVIGSAAAVMASPLAVGTASAATTSVAIVPAGTTTTMAHGATATVNYTVTTDNGTKSAPASTLVFVSGPDSNNPNPTVNCVTETGGPVFSGSCSFTNLYASNGTDVVRITSGGQQSGTTAITLTGAQSTTTGVTIDAASQDQNVASGGTATLNVHYTPVPPAGQDAPPLFITTQAGTPTSDGTTGGVGTACVTRVDGTGTCSLNSTHGATQNTVYVFADNNNNGSFQGGTDNASSFTNVTFTGAPASVQVTGASTAATNTCSVYTISSFDSLGHPAVGANLVVTLNETGAGTPTTPTVVFYNADCATGADVRNGFIGTFTVAAQKAVVADSNGQVKIGIAVGNPGSGNVTAVSSLNTSISGQQLVTWTAGGPDSVVKLTATPGSRTQYTNTVASYTVHANDAGGNPVQGVQVNRQTTAPDSLAAAPCGTTNPTGDVICTVTNSGAAGTDTATFWVNNNAVGGHTTGPDANEPQTTATATFNTQPTFNSSALTCVQQLAGPTQGTGVTNCTVSTATKSIAFTETLKNNGAPVSGAIVDFSTIAATLGGVAVTTPNLPAGSVTTDANGNATFTISNPNPANNDAVAVSAKVGSVAAGNAGASWKTSTAAALSVTPPVQSVQKGGTVSVTVQITDQFGTGLAVTNLINWATSGRNSRSANNVPTNGSGSLVITYTDTTLPLLATTDTINVVDTTSPFSGSATVNFINGPTAASTVVVDTSGSGTTDPSCNLAGHTAKTNAALGTTTTVCATVKNSSGEVLAGKNVTFNVSSGQVAKVGGLTAASGTTVSVLSDAQGVAFADVTSTKSGAQTVSAVVDSIAGSSTVTYLSPPPASARNIKVAPASFAIGAGSSQKFTATVTDAYGNPVSGVSVLFTQSGPGNIGGSSSSTLTTATDGTAAVTVATAATDAGTGSIVASLTAGAGGTQCGALANAGSPPAATAGNCTFTASYTVSKPVSPTSLALQAAGEHKVGAQELIAATVTNSDGTPAVNQVVRFQISGANSASGSGVTTKKGVAFFAYTPTRAGTDHATAYDDIDNNSAAGAGEPTGNLSVSITSGAKEHPSVRLSSAHGTVTIKVTSHPSLSNAVVTYYIEHLGRFHEIGSNRTGSTGKAHLTVKKRVGVTFTFKAKVSGKSGVKGGTSSPKSIRVEG